MHDYLAIHPEVAEALQARKAVVALESTIITHGMPFPKNLEMARDVEAVALPVLGASSVLTDDDLIELVRTGTAAKQTAIAGRPDNSGGWS